MQGREEGDSRVKIVLPDGSQTSDNNQLSSWLGRSVALSKADSASVGTYETTLTEDESGDWVQWSGPEGSFHDSTRTKVSLACVSTFRQWDRRRFRMNVLLDGEGGGENDLVGKTITLGSARLEVLKQVDRCVVVTRPQPSKAGQVPIERDLSVLKTINRELDGNLGVGSVVTTPGVVSVGDEVQAD